MAILKSVVDVNNGNTGWTKTDVLDALETVFANLGWNNGTAATGVPCVIKAPGWSGGNSSADLNKYRDTTLQWTCLLYTSPSPRDRTRSRMPSSA